MNLMDILIRDCYLRINHPLMKVLEKVEPMNEDLIVLHSLYFENGEYLNIKDLLMLISSCLPEFMMKDILLEGEYVLEGEE